jgi:U4/U6 small nuclear ribonucleoprotein PRP3
LKRDEDREDSVEPRHSSHSHKRKDREHSEDRELEDKRIRVSEVKKERRKFGDKVKKEDDYDNDSKVKEEVTNGAHGLASSNDNASPQNVRFFYAF